MCSLASQTCRRIGLLNCCHGIGTIRTCRWSLELGIMLYAIRGPRRVLSMVAPTASMNPTVVTTGPEFGLDLGRSISAVSKHIIAGVARVQQPIQLLAVVHGSIGHGIMPDQLVLGVRVHMVLVAEEAAAMLLGPARIAVLLPHFGGLLLPPRWCAPSLQLG